MPNELLANLPENWTPGQIVSPDGLSSGLTEPHGYNYLMKQVNATQVLVNEHTTDLSNKANPNDWLNK